MKIYILPIHSRFQPPSQCLTYPAHNHDYGVEQDFLNYVMKSNMLVERPEQAEWHYLPVYWTRWHLNHDYGKFGSDELQTEMNKVLVNDLATFTICQYDDGPIVNIGRATQFLASWKSSVGLDIPLLSKPHRVPFFKPRKKYQASFVGRFANHPIRQQLATALAPRKDILVVDDNKGARYFVDMVLSSSIALCPRGYGGSSFRFFEAMQLGVVPFLIGDIDTRPFKRFISWDELSFFSTSADDVLGLIDSCSDDDLRRMGQQCVAAYQGKLAYQRWCDFVIRELEHIRG